MRFELKIGFHTLGVQIEGGRTVRAQCPDKIFQLFKHGGEVVSNIDVPLVTTKSPEVES